MEPQFLVCVRLRRADVPSFGDYPFNLPAISSLDALELHKNVTFLVGENGSGKSTLLEGIAVAAGFNAEGGSSNFRFSTSQTHSGLHDFLRLSRGILKPRDGYFLRAESFYNVATEIDLRDSEPSFGPPISRSYGGSSLHTRSHGEAFMALFLHRFGGHGLYLLDEPEAALSAQRQLALLVRLHHLISLESQFVIATHSPILLSYPDALIYQCSDNGIEAVKYEETDAFTLTKRFLNNPAAMLRDLLE